MERVGILKSFVTTGSILNPSSSATEASTREDDTTLRGKELKNLHEVREASPYGDIKNIDQLMEIYTKEFAKKSNGKDKEEKGKGKTKLNPVATHPIRPKTVTLNKTPQQRSDEEERTL